MDFEEIFAGEFYYILVLVKIVQQQWALSMKICMCFHAQL
jgi:hypothetical protein